MVGDEAVIEVRGLRMRYGSVDVLREVDFVARRGEVVALLGPNGAGKTTTIEILEGFRMRSAGEVRVLGVDPEKGGERWRARLGIVLQSWRDHGKWRVRELLDHLGRYYAPYGTPERKRPWDADDLIKSVGLGGQAGKNISPLRWAAPQVGRCHRDSRQTRITVPGRAHRRFDPHARREFHDLVHRLSDLEDTTILLTTHDLDEAEKLADRILILAGGTIIADGSADALSRRMSTNSEVKWTRGDEHFVDAPTDATRFVRELFGQYGEEISDLEVRRASLEDAYMALVHQFETGQSGGATRTFEEVGR